MNPERLLQHFDCLSEPPDAIPRLRRFILDLAVRGKLVEQDPNDEPIESILNGQDVDEVLHSSARPILLMPITWHWPSKALSVSPRYGAA